MSDYFSGRYPHLFHVTERTALPSIKRHGLLSASALCDMFEVPPARRAVLLDDNRDRYELLQHAVHGTAVLRRQLLRDPVLASRLAPGLSPTDWRRFINSRVFFVVSAARAIGLRKYDRYRDQVILAWSTQAILEASVELLACRYNNGMADRSPPHRRRLRSTADYVPVGRYADSTISEVAAAAIPAGVQFTLWNSCT